MVITDANMPNGISGFQLAATLRKREKTQNVPIMFLTGRKDKTDVTRALGSGADDYVVKPIDHDILLAKVEALLTKKNAQHGFTMIPIKAAGTWDAEFEIVGISEQGLNVVSKCSLPANTKIKLKSELFAQIGLQLPQVRVMNCSPFKETANFFIEVSFVGLTEQDLTAIRRWILSNHINSQKAA